MASGRPRRPNDPSVMSSVEFAARRVRRSGAFEFCWNWRWELGSLAATAGLSWLVAARLGLIGLAATAGAGLGVLVVMLRWPPARDRIIAWAWCVITPHRIRAGCINAWVRTRSGRLPLVLSTIPADYGQRVQLWCRAGITAADLSAARHVLAAACWAAEVRVIASPRYAHIVTLEVIRHPHPERTEPTPDGWPYSRHMEADPRDDPDDRTTLSA